MSETINLATGAKEEKEVPKLTVGVLENLLSKVTDKEMKVSFCFDGNGFQLMDENSPAEISLSTDGSISLFVINANNIDLNKLGNEDSEYSIEKEVEVILDQIEHLGVDVHLMKAETEEHIVNNIETLSAFNVKKGIALSHLAKAADEVLNMTAIVVQDELDEMDGCCDECCACNNEKGEVAGELEKAEQKIT